MASRSKLRILHCFLDPTEKSFRNVRDIIIEQTRLGYEVGCLCSSKTLSLQQEADLKTLTDLCTLGTKRISISTSHGLRDISNIRSTRKFAQSINANILHGHGYKAGIYARFAAGKLKKLGQNASAYYTPDSISGASKSNLSIKYIISQAFERRLSSLTQGIIFDSYYAAQNYVNRIGEIHCQYRIIPKGLSLEDFSQREHDVHAADFLFYGDLVKHQGADLFIEALSGITVQTPVTAVIVGKGPEKQALEKQAEKLRISENITFIDELSHEEAFSKGRCLIIPARKDIIPYTFLEAAAAEVPFIATDIGSIAEIIDGTSIKLIPTEDPLILRTRMEAFLLDPIPCEVQAELFAEHICDKYKVDRMVDEILEMYFSYT